VTLVKGVVLFPGSGSSASHSSLIAIDEALTPLPVARVDFPYRKAGKSFPDKAPVLVQCVKEEVRAFASSLGVETSSLVIGGRSMGGRMCSMAVADSDDPLTVAGLVLVSYPLHPPKKPDALRIEHLPRLRVSTLCVSGTKDDFGTPKELLDAFSVAPATVTWSWIENARHELARKDAGVASIVSDWVTQLSASNQQD
jgi:predicted alpha/beta-hydrolase family hydrolase